MTNEIFDEQLLLSHSRLEKLWQQANKLQNTPAKVWLQADQCSEKQQELLRESLEELSFSLEEVQVMVEELYLQNEELAKCRVELEAERQRYEELFESGPDGHLVTNPEGVIIEANQKVVQWLNVSQNFLVGKPIVVLISAEERRQFYFQLSQLQTGKSIKNWQVQLQSRQGGSLRASVAVVPIQNQQKQVVRLRWRLLELTPTNNETIEKRNSHGERVRSKPVGVQANQDGKRDKEDQEGFSSLLTTDDYIQVERYKGKSLFSSVLRPVKSYRQEQTSPSNQLIELPSQPLVVAAEQAGRVLNEILSCTPDGFLITARTGQYIYVNRTAAQALGFEQSDFIGKTWQQLGLPRKIMERFDAQREAVFTTGEPITDEISVPTVNGIKDYEYTINLISDINSDPEVVIVTVKDITKHKRAAAEARIALAREKEMSALKSESAFVVAQELRNLLHNIFSYLELIGLNAQQEINHKKLNYFRRIHINLRRINQLLDDLLWIGKIEAGEVQLNPALLDLTKFCRELLEELQQGVHVKHQLTFSSQVQYPSVCMDRKLLRYVLINLLLNAINYSPKGSEVKLDVVCHERQAIFRIQDFGIGIPQQDRELIFKAFHRGSNVGAVAGKGLGLAVVKQCVDLQEGEISLETEEGIGTVFTVKLPLNLQLVKKKIV